MTPLLLALAQCVERTLDARVQKEIVMKFMIGDDLAGRPTWWLQTTNDQLVACAGRSFTSSSEAKQAAVAFKTCAKVARYEVHGAAARGHGWHAWCGSTRVASSVESFRTPQAAKLAADDVQHHAGAALGLAERLLDLTKWH